jgi:hypothetical protein
VLQKIHGVNNIKVNSSFYPHIAFIYILIISKLPSHLRPDLSRNLVPWVLPTKTVQRILIRPVHATCHATRLELIALKSLVFLVGYAYKLIKYNTHIWEVKVVFILCSPFTGLHTRMHTGTLCHQMVAAVEKQNWFILIHNWKGNKHEQDMLQNTNISQTNDVTLCF